jgi:hypothetical protein
MTNQTGGVIQEVNPDELKFIDQKKKEYLAQGVSDLEATQLASEDYKKFTDQAEAAQGELWNRLTKQVGLVDFLDDQIRRALGVYKTDWEKKHQGQTLDFKLHLQPRRAEGGLIGSAALILEIAVNGVWKKWNERIISFRHVREMRDANAWKLTLYESMFQYLISCGVTFRILSDQFNEQQRNASK